MEKGFGVDNLLAHTHPQKPPEALQEHKERVEKYFLKILHDKVLGFLELKDKEFLKNLVKNIVLLHDEGKHNPNFQYFKMQNEAFKSKAKKGGDTSHSYLGAKLFFKKFIDEVESEDDDEEYYKKLYLLFLGSFLISKHHSKLSSFKEFIERFNSDLNEAYEVDFDIFGIEIYFFAKYINSMLISSDYYATMEYMANLQVDDFGALDLQKAKEEFEKFYNNLPKENPIDKLRNTMFHEATNNLAKNKDKNIFYLQAPTGAGKTLMSLNLALHLNPRKIFYIFPFNTLVEQTKSVIERIFSFDISIINSITPIEYDENDLKQYEEVYANRLFYNYPFIITTHVNLFEVLFGVGKEENFAFWQLYKSVIILDEIQSYDINLWWYMTKFFDLLEIFEIKVIIMSATLPKLDNLIGGDKFVELLDPKPYFTHPLFKERIQPNFELLEKKIDFETLSQKILEQKGRILVEFIKKSSANAFYEYLKEQSDNVYLLSGDDNKLIREYIIDKCKQKKELILIATQVIEAGVDIDMDVGFKDISLLESEEQFAGRINRNAQRSGTIYFFDLDDASSIYKDLRAAFTIKQNKEWFLQKEYETYYAQVLEKVKQQGLKIINTQSDIEAFEQKVKELDFAYVKEKMTLIKTSTFTIFIPYKIDLQDERYKNLHVKREFIKEGFLDGEIVWERFKEYNEIEEFAKKQIHLSYINYLMQFFTYNVFRYGNKPLQRYSDECCGIYLIAEYESFISEDLRFLREKFNEFQEDMFL